MPPRRSAFPAVAMGVQAIKLAITECDEPLRIAICGDDAIRLALALSEGARGEIMIVTSGTCQTPARCREDASLRPLATDGQVRNDRHGVASPKEVPNKRTAFKSRAVSHGKWVNLSPHP